MKQYFKRLKTHPGLFPSFVFTIPCIAAGATNEHIKHWYNGALLGLGIGSIFLIIVLLSNIKTK